LSGGALAVALSQQDAAASVPAPLLESTMKAATVFPAGTAEAGGRISAPVVAPADGVVEAVLYTKLKIATSVVLVVGLHRFAAGNTLKTYALPRDQARIYDTQGHVVEAGMLPTLFRKERVALVVFGVDQPDPLHLRLFRDGTLVLVLPSPHALEVPPPIPPQ